MQKLRLIFIALISFIGVLIFSSTSSYTFFNEYEKADAATPSGSVVQKDQQKIAGCLFGVCVGVPKIPGIPGVPSGDILGTAKAAVIKQIGESLGVGSPLLLDQKTAYPDVSDQVKDFHPKQLTITSAEDLQKPLLPGDYSISVIAYCTQFSIHAPGQGLAYKLAPLQGKQAPAIGVLLSRGTLQGIAPATLNADAWRIQAGLPLKQWPSQDQALIHKLIPEYEKGLQGDYLQRIEDTYNQYRLIPGIPSFNDLLRQAGAPGQLVLQLRQARQVLSDQTIAAERLPDMLYEPTGDGLPRVLPAAKDASPSPWAEVQPDVFARFTVIEGNLGRNLFELRVTPKAKSAGIDNQSAVVATKELDEKALVSQQSDPPVTPASVVCNSSHTTYSKDRPAQALIPACGRETKTDDGKKHKGVTVYIWDYTGILKSVGHASMRINDADNDAEGDTVKTYISWWPDGFPYVITEGVIHTTLDQDIKAEGYPPNHTIEIPCLDEEKIKTWWLKFGGEGKLYCIVSFIFNSTANCAGAVEEGLYAGGGANILPIWETFVARPVDLTVGVRPQSILELAERLRDKCPTSKK